MTLGRIIASSASALMLTGCIATAPVSFAWRSNSTQQYATTEGKTDSKSDKSAVNAEKTSNLDTRVNTGTQKTEDRGKAKEEDGR